MNLIARSFLILAISLMTSVLPAKAQEVPAGTIVPLGTLIQPRTVTTSGSFAVEVPPNQVILQLGVRTSHADLGQARGQNDERTKIILSQAKALGIPPEQIQTGSITIQPRYSDKQEDFGKVSAYVVERRISIDLRDISKFETLLVGCLQKGANFVYSSEFQTTELNKHRMEARKQAAKLARDKADVLAAELGAKVGQVRTITETSPDSLSPFANLSRNNDFIQSPGSAEGGETVAPGHISVRSIVTAVFDLQ